MLRIKTAIKSAFSIIFILGSFILTGLFSCSLPFMEFENPVDPESENYQGYQSIWDPLNISYASPDAGYTSLYPPEIVWSEIIEKESYFLQIDNDEDFSSPFLDAGLDTFRYSPMELPQTGTWYWRAGVDNEGTTIWTQDVPSFIIEELTPTGIFPPHDELVNLTVPEVFWDPIPDAVSYEIQFIDSSDSITSALVVECTGSSYTPSSSLTMNETYYWRMRGVNQAGQKTIWSSIFHFTVNYWAISGLQPVNWTETEDTTPEFIWNKVTDADGYEFQIIEDTDSFDTAETISLQGNTYTLPSPLSNNNTYTWRVRAVNDAEQTPWSSEYEITVNWGEISGLLPIDNTDTANTQPDFRWDNVSDADHFEIQIAPEGADPDDYSIIVYINSYTPDPSLSMGESYNWRVKAVDSDDQDSAWSTLFTINIVAVPVLTTTAASGITGYAAQSGGSIATDNGSAVTRRGVCWNTTGNPTVADITTDDGIGTGSFIGSLTDLSPGTTYYVRAYAINVKGTAYGEQESFTTDVVLPDVTTAVVSDITGRTATSGGGITDPGGGTISARGVCWSTSENPTVAGPKTGNGTGSDSFTSAITGLNPVTTYFVRAYATNSAGTSYGQQETFETTIAVPRLTTAAVTDITGTTATSGGGITDPGGGTISARGVCWSTSENPATSDSTTDNGSGTGGFTSYLTGLSSGTTYFVRAYAENESGTGYGPQESFITSVDLPSLTTASITDITGITAVSGGNITDPGSDPVTARGVCWSTGENPVITDSITSDGTGTGVFISTITGLTPGTTYYVRAYAENIGGVEYAGQETFTTFSYPAVTTTAVTAITGTTASSGGTVTYDGGGTVATRGVCWSTSENPTILDSATDDGTGTGSFTSGISGLSPGTTYYARAYVTNEAGTAYGAQESFTTNVIPPTITTTGVSSITGIKAISGGNVTSDGGGSINVRGVCWSTAENPTSADSTTSDGTEPGSFSSSMGSLSPGTLYYVRAYAVNSEGTSYGQQETFTTEVIIPTVSTTTVSNIDISTADSGGNVTDAGGGTITERGICWNTTGSPTTADSTSASGSGNGSYSASLSGLMPWTDYYVRAYAVNSAGTAYGNEDTFTTDDIALWARTTVSSGPSGHSTSISVDIDTSGNVYVAGNQYNGEYTYGTGVSVTGSGAVNCFLVKYDDTGTALWARSTVSGTQHSTFVSIAVDGSGAVYVVGRQYGTENYGYGNEVSVQGTSDNYNGLLIKYDGSGNAQWAEIIPSGDPHAVTTDSSGNVYVAGEKSLVKYDSSGTLLWTRTVTGASTSVFRSAFVDASDNIYTAGYQIGTGTYTYGTGVSIAGTYTGYNPVIVKYDSSGDAQWAKTVSTGPDSSRFWAVTCDGSGNVYTAGYQRGGTYTYGSSVSAESPHPYDNSVIVKYDSSGDAQWAKVVETSTNSSMFNSISCNSAGFIYAAGYQIGTATFNYDTGVAARGSSNIENTALVKYDPSGNALWARSTFSGGGRTKFSDIALDSSDNILTIGMQEGAETFNYGDGVSAAGPDGSASYIGHPLLIKWSHE